MRNLEKLNKLAKKKIEKENPPNWVSDKNKSHLAFCEIKRLKSEKIEFINHHSLYRDFKKKSNYQISATELAKHVGASVPTLIATSNYSHNLKAYLKSVNDELKKLKDEKIKTRQKSRSKGKKQQKKDELVAELRKVKKEFNELKKTKTEEQVRKVISGLSLSVKRKLGIQG